MPVYLGTLGRMVKLPYVTSQSVEAEDRYSFQTTLEGRRKSQVKPVGRRTWSLATQHFRPNESALLSQFANGAWGSGPFVFVSADAAVTNLLSPAASWCETGTFFASSSGSVISGGPLTTADGVASRSVVNSSAYVFWDHRVPVISGRPVTASVYVQGAGGFVRLVWYDTGGKSLGSVDSSPAVGGVVQRLVVTAVPPAGAVSCRVAISPAAVRGCWPAVTWSDRVLPFGSGQGCQKAVVHSVSQDVRLAVPGATYLNLSFTVSEVG